MGGASIPPTARARSPFPIPSVRDNSDPAPPRHPDDPGDLHHRAETYDFRAGLYVDRESLLRRCEAPLLIRPQLQVHGVPVSLKLLETPV